MQVDIAATPQQIWQVLIDVESWPQWTTSMTRVQRLDSGPFSVGSRARVLQPKLPANVWRVVDLQNNRGFVWENKSWGAHTSAEHWIIARAEGSVILLKVRQTGLLAALLSLWVSKLTRAYMETEAQGLKRRCEGVTEVRSSAMSS